MTSPVDFRRNSRRSSRYASPRRRATATLADPPIARSCSSRPSSDVDGRLHGRHRRAVLHFAVPAAVRELLTEEALDQGCHVDAEVGARRHDVAVDARLDLALEEGGVGPGRLEVAVTPGHLLAYQPDGPSRLLAGGVEAEPPQELEDVERVGPVLRPGSLGPPAIGRLEGEQRCAPSLGRDPRSLDSDDIRRLPRQVAHDLPADRGVGIEQPIDDGHFGTPSTRGA